MGLSIKYEPGQTPLDEDEKKGLLIKTITTQRDLDEVEQLHIEEAIEWTMRRTFRRNEILTEKFIQELHRRMYGNTWQWAGEFRKTNKNIGVDKFQIGITLRQLLDDCTYWIDHKSFPENEIAIRFKHRIVSIHCFPNGNGRHSRLIADVIMQHIFGQPVFSWGSGTLRHKGTHRSAYLAALKLADKGNIDPLVKFAAS